MNKLFVNDSRIRVIVYFSRLRDGGYVFFPSSVYL